MADRNEIMSRTIIYGDIPTDLVTLPLDGLQVSPFWPGSVPLEALQHETYDGLIMWAPANTVERRHEMALALRALKIGAPICIFAPKDKGGTRLAKELASFGVLVRDQPKRHHRMTTAPRPQVLYGIEEAISAGELRLVTDLGLLSQPGLFSWDRLDIGTACLLTVLPQLVGRIGDFGCGSGVLSKAVLTHAGVSAVTGFDRDRRAIKAAVANITDPRFSAVWVDLCQEGAGVNHLDSIVMNPPFHFSGKEDISIGIRMIERAADALRPGGCLWLTANRHLPYEAVLRAHFKSVTLCREALGYKVYQAIL
ncbi:class I SAM-dependent methyltransferase [Candidatus Phycosocius spiralis]|uniref:Methyltransferase n=1 Tax=Candidatus Phycosocius spiralis TaxID=2815099 RepID=A0ABQ4PWN7_9PROT|nr:class I SAM-dependent methyltransferase [Candidatus Phycosocius spiralis]GIU67432.1 methyltransferase [Candidatus Phycosocius spiralis]